MQQKSFGLIIGMMSHTHVAPLLGKPMIAQRPCSHFNALPRLFALLMHIEMLDFKRNVILSAKSSYKLLIGFTLFSTQMEIAMQGSERELQLTHD